MAGEESLNPVLSSWRQGDCALGPHWFVFRSNPSQPITAAGRSAANEGIDLAEEEVAGVVVVTQTCDIVRAPAERPFVEISPWRLSVSWVLADRAHRYPTLTDMQRILRTRGPALT